MKYTLKVDGMSCEHCVKHVTESLESVPGVSKVSVDLAKGKAQLEAPDDLDEALLLAAVSDAGYTASPWTESEKKGLFHRFKK